MAPDLYAWSQLPTSERRQLSREYATTVMGQGSDGVIVYNPGTEELVVDWWTKKSGSQG